MKAPSQSVIAGMENLLRSLNVRTVCESACCPNQGECFAAGTATFMLLGDICTRNCSFCAVSKGKPVLPDDNEPRRIADAVQQLGLRYVVMTSVTRDDLPDGGAWHIGQVLLELCRRIPETRTEILIPDFAGSEEALRTVLDASPSVLGHNLETVPRLYPNVRPKADYHRSLEVIRLARYISGSIITKSGLMLGLGESRNEVIAVLRDLRENGCDIITLGQYLSPSPMHHPVVRFVTLEEFDEYERLAMGMGFKFVASGPFVRSSFHAREAFDAASLR